MVTLIVLSGAAVRLTGSGLGCSDWPDCTHGHLTPPLQFHSLVEFGNRLVTVVLTVVVAATVLASLRRLPFRRDLVWLSLGLVGGVVLQAVMGGIVVYTKLNPYVVMVHFLASMPLVVVAVVLLHRATRDYSEGSGRLAVPRPVRLMSWLLAGMLTLVLAAGSATTGASPDAGSSQGQERAKRIPVSLHTLAELHATMALFLVGFAVALALALHAMDVPERVRRAGRVLVMVFFVQAGVGYAQYFSHLPALLVELHVTGATILVIGVTYFVLSMTHHPPERLAVPDRPSAGTGRSGEGEAAGEGRASKPATPASAPEGAAVG
jgi:heme a synthase